jgi:hypothetical protein
MSNLRPLSDAELLDRERRLLSGLRKLYFELERRERERQIDSRYGVKMVGDSATPETGLAER